MCRLHCENIPMGLGFLPAILGALMLLGIMITYLIASLNDHVSAFFPYISDAGVRTPESCIFSQLFNMAAALGVWVMYLRYKLIHAFIEDEYPNIRKLSTINLVIACFSCLGLSMVANFQENKIEAAHLTGAILVFGLGVTYAFIDAYITYCMYPSFNGKFIYIIRFVVGSLGLVSLITSIIAGTISRYQWAANPPDHPRLEWNPSDPGFIAHLCSTFGEWGVAASFLFYHVTFIRDFQRFNVIVEPTLYVSHLDERPLWPEQRAMLISPEERERMEAELNEQSALLPHPPPFEPRIVV